ncbi:MAG: hypothetical protein V4525_13670 [Pseudomonadota bacterium]
MSVKINYPQLDALQDHEEHLFDKKIINKSISNDASLYKQVYGLAAHRPVTDYGRIIDFENSSVLLFKIISLLDKDVKNNNKPEIIPPLFRVYKKNSQQTMYERNIHLRECFFSSINAQQHKQLIYHDKNSIVLEGGIRHGNVEFKREGNTLILEIKSMPGQMWTQTYDSFIVEQYFNGEQPGKAYEIHFRSDAHVLYYQDVIKKLIA